MYVARLAAVQSDYNNPGDNLETAQANKQLHLAAKMLLEPGPHILDIRSGWGESTGGAAVIITNNIRDFKGEYMDFLGIRAVTPGMFIKERELKT